jgi:nucleoside-diphosphate-sugar epimerase
MPKNKLLIIGGSGFIGRHIVKEALKKKYNVTILHFSKKKKNFLKNINYINSDVNDLKKIKKILKVNKFDYVINAGGYIDHSSFQSSKKKILNTHLNSIIFIVDLLSEQIQLKKFIQISSSDVYSTSKDKNIEGNCEIPFSFYGYAKLSMDHYLTTIFKIKKFPFTSFRLFITFGEYQDSNRLIPYIITSALSNKKIIISDPDQIRDFVYIGELSKIIVSSLKQKKVNGKIINLGSGRGTKVSKIAKVICKKLNYNKLVFKTNKDTKIKRKSVADISLAKKILNWKPKNKLTQDIDKTILYYKKEIHHE